MSKGKIRFSAKSETPKSAGFPFSPVYTVPVSKLVIVQ